MQKAGRRISLSFFRGEVADVEILSYSATFVSIFLGFFRTIVRVTEGILTVTYGLTQCVQRFYHNELTFLRMIY